jgi:hypothetical protein
MRLRGLEMKYRGACFEIVIWCAKRLSSGPAWREVEFALRYRVSNSPVKNANFLSCFLRLWLQKLPAEHRSDCAKDAQQPASSGAAAVMMIGGF